MINFILFFAVVILSSYIGFNKLLKTDKKEDFKDVGDLVKEIKNTTSDILNNINNLEKSFDNFTSSIETFDDELTNFFNDVGNMGDKLLDKFVEINKRFFNMVIDKVFNPKNFVVLIKSIFTIIWKTMKKVYNIVTKRYPEINYLIYGGLVIATMPFMSFFTTQMVFMNMFMSPLIVIGIYLSLFFAIYLNFWKILWWLINYIVNTLMKLDWDDIIISIAKEFADIFKDLFNEITKIKIKL